MFLPAVTPPADAGVAHPDATDAGAEEAGDVFGETSAETDGGGPSDASVETDGAWSSETSLKVTDDEPSAACASTDASTLDLGNDIDVGNASQLETHALDADRNTLCVGLQAWSEAAGQEYTGGFRVKSGEPPHAYRCRAGLVSGWCPLATYQPGVADVPWRDAWQDLGPCN